MAKLSDEDFFCEVIWNSANLDLYKYRVAMDEQESFIFVFLNPLDERM